jgi:ubiquitin-conjugating enzyme E2 Q
MLYVSNSDDADPAIAAAVETFSNTELYPGCTIARLLEPLSRFLQSRQLQTGDVAHPFLIDDDDLDDFLEDEDENDDILVGDFDDMAGASFPSFDGARDHTSGTNSDANPKQARADLRAVREAGAGFKVGVISRGGEPGQAFLGAHYVSVAISINKLELSEDVIKAWGINSKNDYLVLLFYYPAGYYSLETLSASPSTMKNVKLGVFTSHTYRPVSMEDASNAMKHSSSSTLRPVFIANSLAELLNGRLIALINLRLKYGFKWCQAEHMYHASLGQSGSGQDYEESYRVTENEKKFKKFGEDQLGLGQEVSSLSFPLIAFQYTLRQYVSCTEFCLVCHNQQKTDKIEYLKPFVCTSPLW